MKHLLSALFFATIILTQACSKMKPPEPEESCSFQQNSYKQRVSWHKLPISIMAHSSLSVEQVAALKEAINIWNTTRQTEWGTDQIFFELKEEVFSGDPMAEDRHSVVSITTDWDSDEREQAETVLRWEGNRIIEGDIRVNGNKPLSATLPVAENSIDLVALFVHELGHVLGLEHIHSQEYTVMAFELERGNDNRRQPGNLELDALRCEY